MDWLLHDAFDAPDHPRLQADALTQLSDDDWECARFVFCPGVALAEFTCNTIDVWHALDRQQTPPPAASLPQAIVCLFWRKGTQSSFRSLHPAEHCMLEMLIAGEGFATACSALAAHHPEAAASIGPWLQCWLNDDLISAVATTAETTSPSPRNGALSG
jgi:hypothetical protein